MDFEIKKTLKEIDKLAKKHKTQVYAVGGFVRDCLMGKTEFKDIDFVVEGSGIEFAKKLDEIFKDQGRLIEFPDFDTARYLIINRENEGEDKILLELEFAGARSEIYEKNSRKPKVSAVSLSEDLKRRDFTINAMAVKISDLNFKKTGKKTIISFAKKSVIDFYNGQKDLKEKILRTPLDADITFSEDPLRMMRAVRFAAQLNFAIDLKTLDAIHRNRERLKIISAERIKEELFKLLATPTPSVGLILMFQTGLMDLILPEVVALDGVEEIFGHNHKNNLVHTFKVVDNISLRTDKTLLRLAGLLHDIGKSRTKKFIKGTGWTFHAHEHLGKKMVGDISRRLKFSKDEYKYIAKLVRYHQQPIALMDEGVTDSAVRRLIVNLQDDLEDLLILGISDITTGNPVKLKKRQENYNYLRKKIDEVMEKDKMRAFQSPLRGEEIMKLCGLKPGPTVGKIKKAIEEAILEGIIPNDYEASKKYFEEIKNKYLSKSQDWEKLKNN